MSREMNIDYSAVEQALAQNEAPARMRIMTGHGLRALAILIGLSILVLSVGYAWYIAKDPKIVEVEKTVAIPAPVLPQVPEQESTSGNPIVRQYVIFESVEADMIGRDLQVHAGHNYDSSTQKTYSDAFCYVTQWNGGYATRIDLSHKTSGNRPELTGLHGTGIGLSDAQMNELRDLCPYLPEV